MGKSQKKNKGQGSDAEPKLKPPPTDPKLAELRETKILPALKDLKAPELDTRTAAVGAITGLIRDKKSRKLLLREQIVHTVLRDLLTSDSLESRVAGWSILKALATEEESDFCVHLFRLDILTAAALACKWTIETLRSSTKSHQRLLWDLAASLTSLLGNLAGAQDGILQAITNNADIVRFLFTLVAVSGVPNEVVTDALSCLLTLSEDNRQLCEAILSDQENACLRKLTSYMDAGGLKTALACGVLHNLFTALEWQDHSPGLEGACDAFLIPALSKELTTAMRDGVGASVEVLQVTIEVLASIASTIQDTLEKGNKAEEEWNGFDDDNADHEMMDDDALEDAEDDGMDEDADEASEDDEMDDDAILMDMGKVTGLDHEPAGSSGIEDLPTLSAFIEKAVPPLTRLASASPASDNESAIQFLALSALNNLAWTVSCLEFAEGENAAILKLWSPVGRTIWKETVLSVISQDTADVKLAALVTSLAWALMRSLGAAGLVNGSEHHKFISLYRASKSAKLDEASDPFQGLGVKCIGALGQLARHPTPLATNRDIGVFLVTIVGSASDSPAADVVEALDQILEVYGDENLPCDKEVFWKDNFLGHLEEALPKVKAMVKKIDKRKSTELRLRAEETAANLARFIQYKKKNRPA